MIPSLHERRTNSETQAASIDRNNHAAQPSVASVQNEVEPSILGLSISDLIPWQELEGGANAVLNNSIENMSFLDLDTGAMVNKIATSGNGYSVDNGCVGCSVGKGCVGCSLDNGCVGCSVDNGCVGCSVDNGCVGCSVDNGCVSCSVDNGCVGDRERVATEATCQGVRAMEVDISFEHNATAQAKERREMSVDVVGTSENNGDNGSGGNQGDAVVTAENGGIVGTSENQGDVGTDGNQGNVVVSGEYGGAD